MYHIGPTYGMAAAVIWTEYAWCKVVPFGEMEANSSDPKHVGWLMGPSDGLGVLGVAGSGVVGPLYSRPQTPHSGVGRRLVPTYCSMVQLRTMYSILIAPQAQ